MLMSMNTARVPSPGHASSRKFPRFFILLCDIAGMLYFHMDFFLTAFSCFFKYFIFKIS